MKPFSQRLARNTGRTAGSASTAAHGHQHQHDQHQENLTHRLRKVRLDLAIRLVHLDVS